MPAIQSWCNFARISSENLTKKEIILLEAELFVRVCEELKEMIRAQYKNYFKLINLSLEMENTMLEENFLRIIINDILATNEYDLKGIAYYANTHEDIVQEIIYGYNVNPSVVIFRRIMELHRMVREEVYSAILKKILSVHTH